jgi:GNAT superfamily N-acetyltransferase
METIKLDGQDYGYVVDFKNDDRLRKSFNSLTKKVYGFDFEGWHTSGHWGDRYRPYSLLEGDHIVSNISVNVIDFLVKGEKRTYIQIGTVMTDPEHRNQGLSKLLLEKVLGEWRGKCDLIYLFANNSVLNFYPKFGFSRIQEYQYSKETNLRVSQSEVTKLNMLDNQSKELLFNKVNQSAPFSQLSMIDNASLVMFCYSAIQDDNVYYINELDAVVVADFEQDTLYLKDVFCETEVPLDKVISALASKETRKVVLGFTPNDKGSFDENVLIPVDALFILDDRRGSFDNEKLQFPVLSHA